MPAKPEEPSDAPVKASSQTEMSQATNTKAHSEGAHGPFARVGHLYHPLDPHALPHVSIPPASSLPHAPQNASSIHVPPPPHFPVLPSTYSFELKHPSLPAIPHPHPAQAHPKQGAGANEEHSKIQKDVHGEGKEAAVSKKEEEERRSSEYAKAVIAMVDEELGIFE